MNFIINCKSICYEIFSAIYRLGRARKMTFQLPIRNIYRLPNPWNTGLGKIGNMTKLTQERIDKSTTHVVKVVFPNTTNHHDALFGGQALEWMDEVAFITATRFSRQDFVTVSLERIDFKKPIPAGHFAELIGKVVSVGRTSLKVNVEIYTESMHADTREMAIHGEFTMVAVDENRRPIPVA